MDIQLIRELVNQLSSGEKVVLATICRTKGSTPQKSGAAMVIRQDGNIVGTIGGGCAEAEVRREALSLMVEGQSRIYKLDLTNEAAAEEGMVCGGVMDVFLELITMKSAENPAYSTL
ncbi:XdhC family protein [Paradesulfitobacterium ferrireducens]|uniref:XdhC family protein n=1 Tax=Paradesulfitobacterium ferrireducens TaxID=2816476 RepID=UPI001A8EE014|nr:XdhC family protein [Paradesulfitobacterium ferrireducens]